MRESQFWYFGMFYVILSIFLFHFPSLFGTTLNWETYDHLIWCISIKYQIWSINKKNGLFPNKIFQLLGQASRARYIIKIKHSSSGVFKYSQLQSQSSEKESSPFTQFQINLVEVSSDEEEISVSASNFVKEKRVDIEAEYSLLDPPLGCGIHVIVNLVTLRHIWWGSQSCAQSIRASSSDQDHYQGKSDTGGAGLAHQWGEHPARVGNDLLLLMKVESLLGSSEHSEGLWVLQWCEGVLCCDRVMYWWWTLW